MKPLICFSFIVSLFGCVTNNSFNEGSLSLESNKAKTEVTRGLSADSSLEAKKYWISPMPYKNGELETQIEPAYEFVRGALIRNDFKNLFLDPTLWTDVRAQTKVFKLYLGVLYPNSYPKYPEFGSTDSELVKMIQFFKESKIKVAFEVGGVRPPFSDCSNLYEKTFQDERVHLERWIKLGGSIDYLVFDHPIGFTLQDQLWDLNTGNPKKVANKCINSFQVIVRQATLAMQRYYKYFKLSQPQLELGLIESLGYYSFKSVTYFNQSFDYKTTAPDKYPRFPFALFIKNLADNLKEMQLPLNHYGLDFNDAFFVDAKSYPSSKFIIKGNQIYARDYGRIISATKTLQEQGIKIGYIANAFGQNVNEVDRNTLTFYKELKSANLPMNETIFQFWHKIPEKDLPENKTGTSFNIFYKLMRLNIN